MIQQQVKRIGRVFRYAYPLAGIDLHTISETREDVEKRLLDLQGCREVRFINDNCEIEIIIDDGHPGARSMSDTEWFQHIIEAIVRDVDWYEVRRIVPGRHVAIYNVQARNQDEANLYVEEHHLELESDDVEPLDEE